MHETTSRGTSMDVSEVAVQSFLLACCPLIPKNRVLGSCLFDPSSSFHSSPSKTSSWSSWSSWSPSNACLLPCQQGNDFLNEIEKSRCRYASHLVDMKSCNASSNCLTIVYLLFLTMSRLLNFEDANGYLSSSWLSCGIAVQLSPGRRLQLCLICRGDEATMIKQVVWNIQ